MKLSMLLHAKLPTKPIHRNKNEAAITHNLVCCTLCSGSGDEFRRGQNLGTIL